MIPRLDLLFLLLFFTPLFGQTPNGQPDSVRIVPDLPPIMMLPVWDPPGGHLPVGAAPDTLYFEYPALVPERSTWLKGQRWLGLGMVVIFGSLSYHYHQQAEATYQDYLTSGDPAELNNLFHRTQRLDRRAGWCYLGAETGLILVAFSFVLGP